MRTLLGLASFPLTALAVLQGAYPLVVDTAAVIPVFVLLGAAMPVGLGVIALHAVRVVRDPGRGAGWKATWVMALAGFGVLAAPAYRALHARPRPRAATQDLVNGTMTVAVGTARRAVRRAEGSRGPARSASAPYQVEVDPSPSA